MDADEFSEKCSIEDILGDKAQTDSPEVKLRD